MRRTRLRRAAAAMTAFATEVVNDILDGLGRIL